MFKKTLENIDNEKIWSEKIRKINELKIKLDEAEGILKHQKENIDNIQVLDNIDDLSLETLMDDFYKTEDIDEQLTLYNIISNLIEKTEKNI